MRDARSRIRSLVMVRVERALPLVSPSYDLGLTEEEISATWWGHYAGLSSRRQHHPDPPPRS